jgi:alpha-tubulin suppressor-like RCC1 family protein
MANTKIVTNSFKLNAIQQIVESISEPANTIYYVFAGKPSPYANSDQDVLVPNNSVQSSLVEPYDEMVFAKQVTPSDVRVMIPRYNWTSGEVYTQYSHKDGELSEKPFYAVVNATSTYYVYKCLYNNNGGPSTQQPTFSDTSADDEYYETSDGYQWKYMYKVDATTFSKFSTVEYMPVVPDANVSGNSVAGAIDVIQVLATGAKYNNYFSGQFNTSDVKIDGNPLKYSIDPTASSVPEYYTGCIIKITAGTGVGQYRTITRYDVSSFKYIFIDSPFNVVPDATTQYEITPAVAIIGDGKQSINAAARALVNSIGNTIHRVEMLNRGEGYFIATANVVADSVVGVSNTASLEVVIGPKGGHGHDAESELYGSRLGISVKFSNSESGTIPVDNDFRQIGLLKDPRFGELTLYYDTPSGTFIDDEEIFQLELYRLSGAGVTAQTSPDVFGTGTLCGLLIITPGTATYNNTDIITIANVSVNAIANLTTNSTGGITSISIVSFGSGFSGNSLLSISVANSVGGNIRHFNGNGVANIVINDGGQKYSNSDYLVISNGNINATANIVTDANGTITSLVITDSGNGFLNSTTIVASLVNSEGGSTYGKEVGNISIITGGVGYNNTDVIIINSSLPNGNASGDIVTDPSGTIITATVNTSSNNYGFTNTENATMVIANSTGGNIRYLNGDQTLSAITIVANNPVSSIYSVDIANSGTGYDSTKVRSIEILDGGWGYDSTVNNEILINIGSGATATFTNNVNGKITNVLVTAQGTGYTSSSEASVSLPGDYGVGAIFEVHLTNELIITSSTGYGAVATFSNDASGNISGTLVSNGGFAYSNSSDVFVIVNGDAGGTGANLSVTLIGQANIFSNSDVLTVSNATTNATANIITNGVASAVWDAAVSSRTHTIAHKSDGSLWAWGTNSTGALGLNDVSDRSSPVQIGSSSWTMGSAGNNFSLGIRSDGRLFSWGRNNFGQLGLNNTTDISNPSAIDTSSSWNYVSAGDFLGFAIRTDGALFGWGTEFIGDGTNVEKSSPVQIGTDSWSMISAGYFHNMGIQVDGSLWAWGNNYFGELGTGYNTAYDLYPVRQVEADSWVQISVGSSHAGAIRSDGALFMWGSGLTGRLGDGTVVAKSSPVQIGTSSWVYVSAGGVHSHAIRTDGGLFSWGNNSWGQLGLNTSAARSSPVQVGTSSWSIVSAGGSHTMAIRSDAMLFGWGNNASGKIGDSTVVNKSSPVAIGSSSWAVISAGFSHTVGILSTGELYAWGRNANGELGLNDTADRSSPVQVGTSSWTAASAGADTTTGILNGDFYAWGRGMDGRLGTFDDVSRSTPVQVAMSSGNTFTELYTGLTTTAIIRNDGKMYTIGSNTTNQFTLGRLTRELSPVKIGNDSWTHVAAGRERSFAIRTDGAMFVWGRDTIVGYLGLNASNTYAQSPIQLGTDSWSVVGSGNTHTIAIRTDGSLWTWGQGSDGSLGHNNLDNKSSPTQVGTDSWSMISTSMGAQFNIAQKTDGTLWGWGQNFNGEVGDNSTTSRSSPVLIDAAVSIAELAYLMQVILTSSGSQFNTPFMSIANGSGGYVRYFNDTIIKCADLVDGHTAGLFTNSDIFVATGGTINALGNVVTNSTGGMTSVTITQSGKGFANHSATQLLVVNSTSGYLRRLNTNVCANVVITDGGNGYSNSDYIVVLNGGGNAYANLTTNSTGGIVSIQITDGGYGFDSGRVIAVLVDQPGTLYGSGDVPIFTGGGGTGAAAKVAVNANGEVTYVYVTDGGLGYDCPPTVTLPSTSGTLVELTAFIAPGAAARILNANGFESTGSFAMLEPTIVQAPDIDPCVIYAPNLALTMIQSANLIPNLVESANLTINLSESANLAPDMCGTTTDFINQIAAGDYIFMTSPTGVTDFTTVNSVTNSSHLVLARNSAFTYSGATLYRANVVASGTVTGMGAVNSSIDYVTVANVSGFFTVNNDIVGESSRASGNVTAVLFNNIPKTFLTMNQLQAHRGTLTGAFVEDEYVYVGNSEIANARYHSGNSSMIFLTQPRGDFTVGLTITGNSSGASFVIDDKYNGDISRGSGDIMYIENIQPVSRSDSQSETIKLIVEF